MFDYAVEALDWLDDPVYAERLSDSDRLIELRERGPAARPVGELAGLDVAALSGGQRAELLELLQEQRNLLESIQLRVLAEMQRTDTSLLGLSQEQASATLRIPLRTAQRKLATASTVIREMPATLALMAAGRITGQHAQVLAEAVHALPAGLAAELEERVLDRAADQTVSQLKQSVRRAALSLDPASGEQRHQQALAARAVRLDPLDDGMANLSILLRADDGQLIYTRLTAATGLLPASDPRTTDQQRADLFVDAMLTGLPAGALPTVRGRKPTIQVTVSADTLLNLDDQPGELAGYGAITAETARRLAADACGTWRRLLTDPDTGHLLDISERHYRPSQRLRDYVTARDGGCTFSTCNQPGYRCEYEHIIAYQQGGRTCRCNGALACRRHNQCKVDTGWDYQANSDGSYTWTDDTGRRYRSHPPERWPQPGRSRSRRHPPPAPVQPDRLHEIEDTAYRKLLDGLQTELKAARARLSPERIAPARQAIQSAHRQRQRQLAHRADPTQAPF